MTEIIEKDLTLEEIVEREAYEAGAYDRELSSVEQMRQQAYQLESDPLFFKYQRSEDGVTKAAWLAKVEEIRERYPLPEKPAE